MLFLNAWDCFQGDGTNGGKRKRRRKKKNGRKKRIDRDREREREKGTRDPVYDLSSCPHDKLPTIDQCCSFVVQEDI